MRKSWKLLIVMTVVVAAALATIGFRDGSNDQREEPTATATAQPANDVHLVRESAASAAPTSIAPETYRVAAAFTSRSGEWIEFFTGRLRTPAGRLGPFATTDRECIGLRIADMTATSCGAERYPGGVMHVQRTTFLGTSYVSGMVAPSVAQLEIRVGGAKRAVPLRGRAFVLEEPGQGTLEAFDATGKPLGSSRVLAAGN